MVDQLTEVIPDPGIDFSALGRPRTWRDVVAPSRYISVCLALAGILAWAVSVKSVDPYNAGPAGLVTLLPVLWWVGLALVALSFGAELARWRPRVPVMLLSLVALALVLHGTLPATESIPRFNAAYSVAGFSDYLARTGQTLPRVDARMSWFGVFSATGMAARAMDVGTLWFLRWAPLAFELAYLIPLKALANLTLRSARAQWAALGVFLAANWIDQDYFSPQAIGLLLYLVILVIAIRTFGTRGEQPQVVKRIMAWRTFQSGTSKLIRVARLPYDARPAERLPEPTTAKNRTALLLVVLVVSAVLAVSHQISPVVVCLVLLALVAAGRTRLKTVWLYVAFAVFAWLSWAARPYWTAHLQKIFGGLGNLGSTVSVSVSKHSVAATEARTLVEVGRVAAAGLIWVAAMLGAWMLWRKGRTMWSIAILAVGPIAISGLVSYGGEVVLRILLFSLAPLALFVAALLDEPRRGRFGIVAFAVAFCLLLALFPLDRYGNESFSAFSPGDFAAAVWLHSRVPSGSIVYLANGDEPLPFGNIGEYHYRGFGIGVLGAPQLIEQYLGAQSSYIFLTRSQYEYGTVFEGLPIDWLTAFEANLSKISYIHKVFGTATAAVYFVPARPRKTAVLPPHAKKASPTGHIPVPKPPPPPPKPRTPVTRRTPTTRRTVPTQSTAVTTPSDFTQSTAVVTGGGSG